MNLPLRFFAVIAAAVLVSCDSQDKLMKDQLAWTNDVTEVLNSVADGSLDASDAAKKIRKLREKGEDFMRRKEVLNKDLTAEDARQIAEKYRKDMGKAIQDMMNAMAKVATSGHMTTELQDALLNMKGK